MNIVLFLYPVTMRKTLLIAILSYAIACNSPESSVTTSDSATNTPPGPFSGDTSGGSRPDTSQTTDTLQGTNRTGPDVKDSVH